MPLSNPISVNDLDLSPPDQYQDLQVWLQRNFGITQEVLLNDGVDMPQYAKEVDFVGESPVYIGEAVPGSLTSAAVWRIKEITFVGDDSTTLFADGDAIFDNVWDDRLSLSYS